ncbi:XRE family transcriptional regulator [Streptomyces scopuliridis]|uniref:XRE family transcriptional regulator n=1 Tax=Streptomyces scopuliridis TaxID=452529 RepID=UPI0035DD0CCC
MAAADGRRQREVWTGTELRRLLAERAGLELSSASVSALFTEEPSQVKMTTPNDLSRSTPPRRATHTPPQPIVDPPQAVSGQSQSMPPL